MMIGQEAGSGKRMSQTRGRKELQTAKERLYVFNNKKREYT